MKRNRSDTLALVTRVARVRELKAQQQLALATRDENAQRRVVDEADGRLSGTFQVLHRLRTAHRVDAARMGLFNQLASHADQVLGREEETLAEKRLQRERDSDAVIERSRYRERADERLQDRLADEQRLVELQDKDRALEAWMLVQQQRGKA